ncbi:MAG: hypothetical protein ACPGYT_15235, partial [Nitrospirales bacterium]
ARETAEIGWKKVDVQTFRMGIQNTGSPELKDQQNAYEAYLRDHDVRQFFNGMCEQQISMTGENVREAMLQYLDSSRGNHGASTETSIRIPLCSTSGLRTFDVVFLMEIVSKLWCEIDTCSMLLWVHEPKDDLPYFFATSRPASPKMFHYLLQASRQGQDHAHHETMATLESVQQDKECHSDDHESNDSTIEEKTFPGITLHEIRNALCLETKA